MGRRGLIRLPCPPPAFAPALARASAPALAQVEYIIVKLDKEQKRARVSLRAGDLLAKLIVAEEAAAVPDEMLREPDI